MSHPTYLGSERTDDLARMCTELLSELWTLRDRVMLLECLLEQKNVVARTEIDTLIPDEDLAARLARTREAMVQRVMGAPFTG